MAFSPLPVLTDPTSAALRFSKTPPPDSPERLSKTGSYWQNVPLLAERPAIAAGRKIEVEMQGVVGVAAGAEHRLERSTGGLAQLAEKNRGLCLWLQFDR